MSDRKVDINWIIYALECRENGPDNPNDCCGGVCDAGAHDRLCGKCPYCYDENACDFLQILIDARTWIEETRNKVNELKKAAQL